jgi:hypothetical protein
MNKKVNLKWFGFGLTIIFLTVVLALVVVKVPSVLAQITGTENSEGIASPNPIAINQIIGDDPDENGYTGPIQQGSGNGIPSEATTNNQSNWDDFFLTPQADMNLNLQLNENSSPEWSEFYYVFDAGATLKPRESVQRWGYGGAGCIYPTQNTILFNLDLQIPQGARIDYLRILYYDVSNANTSSWITIYDGLGGVTDLINVASTGNTGYGYEISDYLGHIVDNSTNSYVLNWVPGEVGPNLQLCGLRVAYRLP